jgi:hypothetical protein
VRNVEKSQVVSLSLPSASFYDVRHRGNSRSPDLRRQSESLFGREGPTMSVDRHDKGVGQLERPKLAVIAHSLSPLLPTVSGLQPPAYPLYRSIKQSRFGTMALVRTRGSVRGTARCWLRGRHQQELSATGSWNVAWVTPKANVKKPVAAFMAGLTAPMARPADLGKTIAKVYR